MVKHPASSTGTEASTVVSVRCEAHRCGVGGGLRCAGRSQVVVRAAAEVRGSPERLVLASTPTVDRSGSGTARGTVTDLTGVTAVHVEVIIGGDLVSSVRADLTSAG